MSEPLWFDGPEGWRAWLEEHHETAGEAWLGMYKKHSPKHNMSWSRAVDTSSRRSTSASVAMARRSASSTSISRVRA